MFATGKRLVLVGALFCLCLASVSLSGCSDGGVHNVNVSGKVAFVDGKPLTHGMVNFTPVSDSPSSPLAEIKNDGSFTVEIPPGKYRAFLSPPEEGGEGASGGEGGEPTGVAFNVPENYLSGESSGWEVTIEDGENSPLTLTIGNK